MAIRSGLPLILASASPRRRELLSSLSMEFEVIPSNLDEIFLQGEAPEDHVIRLARMKAMKVAGKHESRWVLAADTVVVIDGKVLGKPQGIEEAEGMLQLLSRREHRVITGYCVLQASTGKSREEMVVSRVTFKAISPGEIRWYLATGEPFDKAGGYAIQGKAAFMVKEINGSYTNVVGLPLTEVVEALQELGAVDIFG